MSSSVSNGSKKLFEKNLNFHHKETSMDLPNDVLRLCLSIEWQSSKSFHNKELLINLTDPVDPFFLYHIVLKAEDFLSLKQEQGLLVDFLNFPQSLIDLLSMCQQEDERREARYLLQLTNVREVSELNAVTIDVVETNKFKLLTHLSLRLVSPSDYMVKSYLTSCFKDIKDENDVLKSKVGQLQQELKKQIDSYNKQQQENNLFEEESNNKLSSLEYEIREKFKKETQKLVKTHRAETDLLIAEQKKKESKLLSNIDNYVSKIEEFEQENESKNREIIALRGSIKDLKLSLQSTKVEQTRMDCGMTAENKALMVKLSDSNHEMNVIKEKKEVLEKLTKEKDKEISDLLVKIKSLTEKKVSLDEAVSKRTIELNKSKEIENTLKSGIVKANDVIRKFQLEAYEMNSMLKNQSVEMSKLQHELAQQEEILSEQQRRCAYFENIVKPQKEKIEMLSCQINGLLVKLTSQEANKEHDKRSKQSKKTVSQGCQTTLVKSDAPQQINLHCEAACEEPNLSSPPSFHQPNPVSLDPRYLERHPQCFIRPQPGNNLNEKMVEQTDTVRNNKNWKPFTANAT